MRRYANVSWPIRIALVFVAFAAGLNWVMFFIEGAWPNGLMAVSMTVLLAAVDLVGQQQARARIRAQEAQAQLDALADRLEHLLWRDY